MNWVPLANGVSAQATSSVSTADGIVTQKIMAGPLNEGDVVPVNACLAAGSACAQFNVVAVHTQTAQLIGESGTSQTIDASASFAPVVLAVTDAIGHPMAGAVVTFYETLNAWTPDCPRCVSARTGPRVGEFAGDIGRRRHSNVDAAVDCP